MHLFNLRNVDEDMYSIMRELVIEPNAKSIINNLFHFLYMNDEFATFVPEDDVEKFKSLGLTYLQTLGKDIDSLAYFESRLQAGVEYNRVKLPLVLYESAMQKLRTLIFEKLPVELEQSVLIRLQIYVSKIISFDMSITNDSYIHDAVFDLQKSVVTLQEENKKYKLHSGLDPLTKTLHSEMILAAAKRAPLKAAQKGHIASYIMFCFPDVISINGRHGHASGDKFISGAIHKVKEAVPKGCQLGRYAANKFLIVMTSDGQSATLDLMRQLREMVKGRTITVGDAILPVTLVLAGRVHKDNEPIETTIDKLSQKLHNVLGQERAA